MRGIAAEAGVAVPTLELRFGTKARLLKAAIDVAIAGDDEPVSVLDRAWAKEAVAAGTGAGLLAAAAAVVTAAQERSAGLVLAVFEGASVDPELAQLAAQMTAQRAATAEWLVDALSRIAPLREDRQEAIETLWILMDPALFDRLTRQRHWTSERYQRWFARSAECLLVSDISADTSRSGRTSP